MRFHQLSEATLKQIAAYEALIRQKRDTGVNRHWNDHSQKGRNIGKIGEAIACEIIGGTIDYTIWETGARRKHFDADILESANHPLRYFRGKTIHVKTTHLHHKGSKESWTIHDQDPIIENGTEDDIILLVLADETGKGYLYGFVTGWDMYIHDCWKNAIELPHKKAIYWKDIQPYCKDIEEEKN